MVEHRTRLGKVFSVIPKVEVEDGLEILMEAIHRHMRDLSGSWRLDGGIFLMDLFLVGIEGLGAPPRNLTNTQSTEDSAGSWSALASVAWALVGRVLRLRTTGPAVALE